jgi:hypothetical protein
VWNIPLKSSTVDPTRMVQIAGSNSLAVSVFSATQGCGGPVFTPCLPVFRTQLMKRFHLRPCSHVRKALSRFAGRLGFGFRLGLRFRPRRPTSLGFPPDSGFVSWSDSGFGSGSDSGLVLSSDSGLALSSDSDSLCLAVRLRLDYLIRYADRLH